MTNRAFILRELAALPPERLEDIWEVLHVNGDHGILDRCGVCMRQHGGDCPTGELDNAPCALATEDWMEMEATPPGGETA